MKRNIILSIADDHRWDLIGGVGDARVLTPNFDLLASRGTAFLNARCQNGPLAAVCIPSRAALHTGREVAETDLHCKGFPTLGETLRHGGYHTHGVGKWHNERASYHRSFDSGGAIFFEGMHDHTGMPLHDFDSSGVYRNPKRCDKFSSVAFADEAISFLEAYDEDRPFFLYLAWTSPHDPRTPPPEFAARYNASALDLPANFLAQHPFDNGELWVRDEMLAHHPRPPEVIQQHLADYFAMVSEMDAQFGRVIAALHRRGCFDETLVIHTSDHGLAVGQHGLMGKQNLYEHSVRIPLLMAGPGIPSGREERGLCYGFDLAPSLLEFAGVDIPETMTARSLLPVMAGNTPARAHATAYYKDFQCSVTDGHWKLIRYDVGGVVTTQLFDLQSDPWETVNRAADCPEITERLMEKLPKSSRGSHDSAVNH